jgi:hypothetical protein
LRLWATANYCRAGIKSLRGTITNRKLSRNNRNETQLPFA